MDMETFCSMCDEGGGAGCDNCKISNSNKLNTSRFNNNRNTAAWLAQEAPKMTQDEGQGSAKTCFQQGREGGRLERINPDRGQEDCC